MTCRERNTELVETARHGMEPDAEMRSHFAGCHACAERWEAELALAAALRTMRGVAVPGTSLAERDSRRQALLREFDLRSAGAVKTVTMPKWAWTLAAAAAVVLAMLAGHALGVRSQPVEPPATRIRALPKQQSILYEASFDASELSLDDFVAVPFTPPLAEGELVRVIRAELYPEALNSMGIEMDPGSGSNIPVEMVVGGDGLPRAVRLTDEAQYQ